ncbi:MAG: hypothetical protein KKA31_01645 [Candidatus Margulisbacteria bacterium]|nr:hypothetical protein [Candidatus Margulisiibacteriota bacterium]
MKNLLRSLGNFFYRYRVDVNIINQSPFRMIFNDTNWIAYKRFVLFKNAEIYASSFKASNTRIYNLATERFVWYGYFKKGE